MDLAKQWTAEQEESLRIQGTEEQRISECCKLADGKISKHMKIGSRWAGQDSDPQSYQYGKIVPLPKM